MRNLFLVVCMSLASVVGGSAHAYQYTYISDIFQVALTPFNGTTELYMQDSVITVHIYTPTLLTAGSTLAPGTAIYMNRFVSGLGAVQQLVYPDPNADPSYPSGTVWNPDLTATMNIGAVDAAGLPTVWDVSLQRQLYTPTGREDRNNFFISNTGDSVWGGYQGFSAYTGASSGPGTWSMGVAAIPEPETYAMLLAGLGVLGVAVRRRSDRSRDGLGAMAQRQANIS